MKKTGWTKTKNHIETITNTKVAYKSKTILHAKFVEEKLRNEKQAEKKLQATSQLNLIYINRNSTSHHTSKGLFKSVIIQHQFHSILMSIRRKQANYKVSSNPKPFWKLKSGKNTSENEFHFANQPTIFFFVQSPSDHNFVGNHIENSKKKNKKQNKRRRKIK